MRQEKFKSSHNITVECGNDKKGWALHIAWNEKPQTTLCPNKNKQGLTSCNLAKT